MYKVALAVQDGVLRPARKVFRTLLLGLCAIAVSACTEGNYLYASRGIGPDLYSADMARASRDLETYLGYLCYQAGVANVAGPLPVAIGSRDYPMCAVDYRSDDRWNSILHTGFNDIDRRCDAYLAWVDDMRRRQIFGGAAITKTRGLTEAVLGVVDNVGKAAVTIVGQAFGFASGVFDDYSNLVLLSYEGSTIETIATKRRTDFRLESKKYTITNKPATVHLLRSYLRICMPYTLRMNANEFARAIALEISPPNFRDERAAVQAALVSPREPLSSAARTDIEPKRQPRVVAAGWGGVSEDPELVIDLPTAKAIQRALCFAGMDADGSFGPKTEAGLKIFKTVFRGQLANNAWRNEVLSLSNKEIAALRNAGAPSGPGCGMGARNYLERHYALVENLGPFPDLAAALKVNGAKDFSDLRTALRQFRAAKGYDNSPGDLFAEQFTPEMVNDLGLGFSQ